MVSYSVDFEANPQPMWVVDRESFLFLDCNPAAVDRYGYSRGDLNHLALPDLCHPDDFQPLSDTIRALNSGMTSAGIGRHLCSDGSVCTDITYLQCVEFEGREALLIAMEEATDRARSEHESLRGLVSQVLYALPDGFIAFDSELRFRFVNPAAEQMLGRTFADIEGVDLLTAFPNSFGYAYYERVLANQEIVTFEMYFEAVGQWIEAQAIPVERGVSVLLRDITTRRMANLMLRSSDEWFRALSEYGSDITILLDDEAKIRYVSQSVQRVLGFPPSALNGQPFFDRIHEEDVQLVTEALQALQASTPIIEGLVYRARHASGEWRFIESTISNQLGNSSVAGLVLHARDVTERIRLQDQLVHSGKLAALGELVAGVAHEINNPLAAISGFAQLLASHPDPQVGQDALAIRNMVDRASKIVHSLRGFARPSNSELEHKASDLNAVVGSALEIAGSTLKHAQVDVGLHLEANLPAVLMNQSEMEQVVVNLLTNAVSAVRDREPRERRVVVRTFSHRVQVSAGRLQTNVSLIVSDNGIGMEPSMARRIFEPFFTSKDRGEGTGLGLYISYGIVSSHGGTLDVITSPGAGATLTVTLPAAKGD